MMSCNQSHVLHDLAILHNHHNFSAKLTNHHNDAAFGQNDKVAQNSQGLGDRNIATFCWDCLVLSILQIFSLLSWRRMNQPASGSRQLSLTTLITVCCTLCNFIIKTSSPPPNSPQLVSIFQSALTHCRGRCARLLR